ncbi:tryptophan synthase subunit alpha [Dyadobacter sp. CY347]|uniref:tryptophan synthase subunit alpha n=1 Tax=Dyadobacter sp. CY347 TaxID=2909336 RepID=UPI001F1C7E81|nr:tryptophan synthase subunit alpha [Dyadobacter sp. CY347]MCF2491448.1 tryptophan synthase subunit alpha [Dyadobacter sp. CY347]
MNRITTLFNGVKRQSQARLLSIYFTAGFPELNETMRILRALQDGGVDMVEIGMPYSDPIADGETIQQSNNKALENGMTVKILFEQLADMRKTITIPILLMGYINPVLQFGVENFCKKCAELGIDGLIIPDLPLDVYLDQYKAIFDAYGILNIFLVTPQTSEKRIRQIDEVSEGFIYTVSSASVTGSKSGISHEMESYFERLNAMQLRNQRLIGFGIKDYKTFQKASDHAAGAIIGSAFIRFLNESKDLEEEIEFFVKSFKNSPETIEA